MSLTARRRQEQILAELMVRRHVSARDLAIQMKVSESTVRRDLRVLAGLGKLELVHGGATLARSGDASFLIRETRNLEAKRTIGRLAADLVQDGDQIFLDSGTTCFAMAAFLKGRRGISVILHSVRLAPELDVPGMDVILLGGKYRPDRMDTVGPLAAASLDQLRGYRAFVGADGLSQDFGPTASDIESADLHRLAIRHAREVNLLVDHTKFSSPSLYKIVDWGAIHRIVTDRRPAAEWMEFLEGRRISVLFPPEEGVSGDSGGAHS